MSASTFLLAISIVKLIRELQNYESGQHSTNGAQQRNTDAIWSYCRSSVFGYERFIGLPNAYCAP